VQEIVRRSRIATRCRYFHASDAWYCTERHRRHASKTVSALRQDATFHARARIGVE
jgi:hypothetical protein